jgi:transcriptional regulator with XRE-family HTH domain
MMHNVGQTAGQWLNDQLDARNIDVRDVATELAVTTQSVYSWLRDRAQPNEDNVAKLARLLKMDEPTVRAHFGYWVDKTAKKQPARVDDEARDRRLRKLHEDAQALAEAIAKELRS